MSFCFKERRFFKKRYFLISVLFFLFPFLGVEAFSEVYIDPGEGSIRRDKGVFSVDVRINVEECVNVVELLIQYPLEDIKPTVVSRGRSILTLWVEDPEIDHEKGEISLIGGIPGGYCGSVAGDPGLTNVLATVVFQPVDSELKTENIAIDIDENRSSVYLSDGRGTEAETLFKGSSFEVADSGTVDASEWRDILSEDETPPEDFNIKIMRDDSVFGGDYYIVFSTVDKGSGISHYLVKEEDIKRPGYVRGEDKLAEFKEAKSPYLLKDQTLNSIITVKAYDNAGNKRTTSVIPDEELRQPEKENIGLLILSVVFIIFVLVVFVAVVIKKRKIIKDLTFKNW